MVMVVIVIVIVNILRTKCGKISQSAGNNQILSTHSRLHYNVIKSRRKKNLPQIWTAMKTVKSTGHLVFIPKSLLGKERQKTSHYHVLYKRYKYLQPCNHCLMEAELLFIFFYNFTYPTKQIHKTVGWTCDAAQIYWWKLCRHRDSVQQFNIVINSEKEIF